MSPRYDVIHKKLNEAESELLKGKPRIKEEALHGKKRAENAMDKIGDAHDGTFSLDEQRIANEERANKEAAEAESEPESVWDFLP